jgi:hypothetical protein
LPPSSPGMEFVFQVTGSGQIRPICPRREICESYIEFIMNQSESQR